MRHQNIYNRLRRIEGQVRGIEEMLASDKPEKSILIQLAAVKSSVSSSIIALIEEMIGKDTKPEQIKKEDLETILHFLKS
jgi:DNA-binding FrmR family transcriptional regulator